MLILSMPILRHKSHTGDHPAEGTPPVRFDQKRPIFIFRLCESCVEFAESMDFIVEVNDILAGNRDDKIFFLDHVACDGLGELDVDA